MDALPAGQVPQPAAAEAENLPGPHLEHWVFPVPFAYVPGSQLVHLVSWTLEIVPSAQGSQLACPKAVATSPTGHLVHEDWPEED